MSTLRRLGILMAAASVALVLHAQSPTAQTRTLVRAGHLLDVKTGKITENQTIVVESGVIQSIAPTESVPAQASDKIVDLSGMTVMPGLIDVHTHLTMNTNFDPYYELTQTDSSC